VTPTTVGGNNLQHLPTSPELADVSYVVLEDSQRIVTPTVNSSPKIIKEAFFPLIRDD
jgi:hypothetical protein